jgi:hypothetical protein
MLRWPLRHERHRRPLRPPSIRVSYLPHHGCHWPLAIRPIRAHAANRFTVRCGVKGWDQKHMIEDRSVVARRLFDALCAKYPDKYIALIQPCDVVDGSHELTAGKAPPTR